jgi:hypothetical protein
MKKITVEYETYKFNELTDEAKQRATTDLLMSIAEFPELYSELENEIAKAQDKVERLYTPWFFTHYLWDFGQNKIEEMLQQEVYLKNGKIFNEGETQL